MFRETYNLVFSILISCFCSGSSYSQTIVRTSSELEYYLKQDKEIGTIFLDGDVFQLGSFETLAGGRIKPYRNRKPILLRPYQSIKRNNHKIINGYWTEKLNRNRAHGYIILDGERNPIKCSSHVNDKDCMIISAKDLIRYDSDSRLFKMKIPEGYDSLKEKNRDQFRNCIIEALYWYRDLCLTNLYSDSSYLYGTIDSQYNYDLLNVRPSAKIMMRFRNFPFQDGGIFLDGNDILHIPERYNEVHMCYSDVVLNLKGPRNLRIEDVTIDGSYQGVRIDGGNKHVVNCTIRNCGDGIAGKSFKSGSCSVINCSFYNLLYNNAIILSGKDILIEGNKIHNTGLVNKGGAAIAANGRNFLIKDNEISSFTYNAIAVGGTEEYGVVEISGRIVGNIIDNSELYGVKWGQLDDGGGIYVWAHTDGVVIEDNIVRNLGYEGCDIWGIYLDNGAYNCTVRRNLVYNMWPGEYAVSARFVDERERSSMNNIFENNIFLGPCRIGGNRNGFGNKTIIRNNYIDGELIIKDKDYVSLENNMFVSATIKKDGKINFSKENKIKKRNFSRKIKKLLN